MTTPEQREIDALEMALDGADIENQALRKRLNELSAAPTPPEVDSVRIPTSANEAELMAKLGMSWLEQNAPERLKDTPPEPVTRFCPSCGLVGEAGEKYRDCCPDGSNARIVPVGFAEQCRTLFKLAIGAGTPPEVEPVAWMDKCGRVIQQRVRMTEQAQSVVAEQYNIPLYTSPPSPKASYDAEGNPLNLMAAARDFIEAHDGGAAHHWGVALANLRKFIGEGS